jgi:hypothetical protein
MKHSERFALNEWLSDYPHDLTFDEVCELLRDEDESVTVWQWFEGYPATEIIEHIDNTRSHFENVVDDLVWGVALANKTEEETQTEQEIRG